MIATKTMQNKAINSQLKTEIKKPTLQLLLAPPTRRPWFDVAIKKIDQAAAKGILHKNTAARRKSALAKKLNAGA